MTCMTLLRLSYEVQSLHDLSFYNKCIIPEKFIFPETANNQPHKNRSKII